MPSRINLMFTYGLLVFIWASTPLAIVWSVADLHPMWALVLRFFIALPLAVLVLLFFKIKFRNQSVAVSFYIKNNPVVFEDTCIGVGLFYLVRIFPDGIFCSIIPGFQMLLRI